MFAPSNRCRVSFCVPIKAAAPDGVLQVQREEAAPQQDAAHQLAVRVHTIDAAEEKTVLVRGSGWTV